MEPELKAATKNKVKTHVQLERNFIHFRNKPEGTLSCNEGINVNLNYLF